MITSRRVAGVERRALATLALAGASLAVGQFLLVREFVSLLYGEELVIVAVSACFFLGLSVGYGVAARLQPARLQAALALCVGAQLLFPAATRVGAAWLSELAYAGAGADVLTVTNTGTEPARAVLLGGTPFGEELMMWWNFVGRSHEEIAEFRAQWQAQSARFGRVSGYRGATEWLPAPPMPTTRLRPRRTM